MKNSTKRILTSIVMILIAGGAVLGEYFNIPAVRYLCILIVFGMIIELGICTIRQSRDALRKNKTWLILVFAFLWIGLMLVAANSVGERPWIVLLMLMIISSADIGGWFFGRIIGGDKMWEHLSAGKTWSGQICGIICGTFAAVMYGLLGTDTFMPQLLWIGISVSLLSQYGDLTASWVKRRLGIKDFGSIIPGHGGILDRFDGWIYVLPLIWLVMM